MTLKVFQYANLDRSFTKSLSSSVARANTCFVSFNSSLDSTLAVVLRSGGHSSGLLNQLGPFHQSWFPSSINPPRLAISAGFSLLGTCLHVTFSCSRILLTRLATNSLYCPRPRIQCNATLLSSQPTRDDTGNPS